MQSLSREKAKVSRYWPIVRCSTAVFCKHACGEGSALTSDCFSFKWISCLLTSLLDVQLLCFANMLVARVLHSLVIASASNGSVACLHLVTENIIVFLSNEEIDLIQ